MAFQCSLQALGLNKVTGLATGALLFSFFNLGLLIASLGAALLAFERQTGASSDALAVTFTVRSVGYLIGSALGGWLLDKFPARGHRSVAGALGVTSFASLAMPFATFVPLLCLLTATQGLAMGILDSMCNVLCIYMHGDGAGPWMQAIHLMFAIGAGLGPLIVTISMATTSGGIFASYSVFAALTLAAAVWIGLIEQPEKQPRAAASKSTVEIDGSAGWWRVLILSSILLGFYVGAETGYGGFLLVYVTAGVLALSETTGQMLCFAFWASIALARAAAIPLSLVLEVRTQLWGNLVVSAIGVFTLLLGIGAGASGVATVLLWIGTAVFGLGLGSVFPTAVMLAESLVDLDGFAASVLMVGAAAGEMVVPLLVGLWTTSWPPGFVFSVGAATLLFSTAAAALLVFEGDNTFGGGAAVQEVGDGLRKGRGEHETVELLGVTVSSGAIEEKDDDSEI